MAQEQVFRLRIHAPQSSGVRWAEGEASRETSPRDGYRAHAARIHADPVPIHGHDRPFWRVLKVKPPYPRYELLDTLVFYYLIATVLCGAVLFIQWLVS